MSNRRILYSVLLASFGIHLAIIAMLHNSSFRTIVSNQLNYVTCFSEHALQQMQRKKRAVLVGQVFQRINTKPLEIKEELHDLVPEFSPPPLVTFHEGEALTLEKKDFALSTASLAVDTPNESICTFLDSSPMVTTTPDLISSNLPPLEVPSLDESEEGGQLADSSYFDVHVEYAPKQNRPGFVFKATFYPKVDVVFRRISQNYYFLIDRSNSIPRGRFLVNKRLVAEALNHLKPNDTFNILVFDDKVSKFADHNQPWNEENVSRAKEFLAEQGHGGYFAATELYSSLGKIIPAEVSRNEVNTAILMSDGDSYLPIDKQRQTIAGWTKRNEGRVSLYSIAMGGGNNIALLDLISAFNQGNLVYAPNHIELGERFKSLIHTIRNPIGKNIIATALPHDKQMIILLQPKASRLPYLYQNRPFVLYGSTNRLSDFTIFLQGCYYDSHFDIKKRISFSEAKLSSTSIEREWTTLVVQEFYERFLKDGNERHLEEAKKLLTPLNLPVPFIADAHHRR